MKNRKHGAQGPAERLEWRLSQLQPTEPADRPTASASAPPPAALASTDILVVNRDSGAYHRTPADWIGAKKTYCGWHYAARRHSVVPEIPVGVTYKKVCSYCLPSEREVAKAGLLSDLD